MPTTTLTITADAEVIRRAERWAAEHQVSLDEAISRGIAALTSNPPSTRKWGPLTKRIDQLASSAPQPADHRPFKERLQEALCEKYEQQP